MPYDTDEPAEQASKGLIEDQTKCFSAYYTWLYVSFAETENDGISKDGDQAPGQNRMDDTTEDKGNNAKVENDIKCGYLRNYVHVCPYL